MLSFFTHNINRFAVALAIVSFGVGTLLFAAYKIMKQDALLTSGFIFVVLAVFINAITLLIVLSNALLHFKDFKEHSISIILLLMNIPVTLFYLYNL